MHKRRIPLVWQIMIGLVAGIAIGALLHEYPDIRPWMVANVLQPAGDIFIKLMKMIVVPIVFSCMVVGIAGHGDGKALGRVGVRALLYFFGVTTTAIIVGLIIGKHQWLVYQVAWQREGEPVEITFTGVELGPEAF